MVHFKRFPLFAAAMLIAGCTTESNPSDDRMAGGYPAAMPAKQEKTVKKNAESAERFSYSGDQKPSAVSETVIKVENSVSELKQTVAQSREAFRTLKDQTAERASRYYELVSRVNARLQIGTTPGNPDLTEMWKQASAAQTEMGDKIQEMKILSSDVNKLSSQITALNTNIDKTFSVPGASESDHERLKMLQDETALIAISQKRLAREIVDQIARQQQAFKNESTQISSLAVGIRNGKPYNPEMTAADTMFAAQAPAAPMIMEDAEDEVIPEAQINGRRPLMVIRFEREKVAYERPLYQAIKAALAKRPSTGFELVAVTPAKAKDENKALKRVQAVHDSLISMGLPESRISVSKMRAASAKTTEVRLFLK